MIYCLNRKQTIKLPNIFYQQICSNLHYGVNSIARNNLKESDSLVLFTHHIQKIEDKREFLPSFDIGTYISAVSHNIYSMKYLRTIGSPGNLSCFEW